MKSQPESTEPNSNNQPQIEPESSSSDPLQDLYDLLNDLTDQEIASEVDTASNISTPSSEANNLTPVFTENIEETTSSLATPQPPKSDSPPKVEDNLELIIDLVKENKAESDNALQDKLADAQESIEAVNDSVVNSPIDLNDVTPADNGKLAITQQWILEKEKQIDELASSVNALIPLMVQLSQAEDDTSTEHILKIIVPIIDRVIEQRTVEDREKMASAIANILPNAIQHEITNDPESIGKAIAPEIALSIREQVTLKEGSVAEALGTEMGQAIKKQIETERDAMVDALYPVIGSTISKYMAEVVDSINQKVDSALSPKGIRRKIRAKIQGVSEAELILKESFPYSVRAIFLIHKDSGLVIRELQPDTSEPLESDLLAGMLTAIRSFANDCIAANSELGEIDYDSFQILLETAGYCYLAVVVNGEPDRFFRDRMRTIFGQIVTKYSRVIEDYQGDPDTIPKSVQPLLEQLIVEEVIAKQAKSSHALYWLIAFVLGVIFIPWGIFAYKSRVANRIEQAVAVELDANPELSVYRLTPKVKKGQLLLKGRVPSLYLRNLAAIVTQPLISEKNLQLDNQIVAVNVPVDPTVTAQEIARTTKLVNQNSEVTINTSYQNKTVVVDGLVLNPKIQKNLLDTFSVIPGVERVVFTVTQELPELATRIYFSSGSSQFTLASDKDKIDEITDYLAKYPLLKLRIIGHSDPLGTKETNLKLARERARQVYQTLVDKGIDAKRLEIVASSETPPGIDSDRPLWLSRCVRFEPSMADIE